ncbi:MAG: ribosome assembly factor SBDS [Candidatus Thermoplasmatota archaeon]|jgi:ribosome maturation protein SDO1|nr:ribosome assembly factor SBDS [Candidatus Thermoplasmatota archaeon]MCL5983049.1 ribosome assembly factor SBDS [Candidatus Thermoplasmatota archaeon]
MVKVDDAVIARWETHGSRFEVLVDPTAAQQIKDGKDVDLSDKLALDQVFKDAKKGDQVSEEHLEKTFHTRDLIAIAREIIQKGEVQVTTEQRHQLQEAKRRQIVATIARNAMNPQTGAPHPPARIESAMAEVKYHVDPFRSVDAQVQEVLTKLRPILPIRFDVVRVKIKVPAQHFPRVIGELKGMGKISEESWLSDGSWSAILEIPAGVQTELYEKLNARTKGTAETALVK